MKQTHILVLENVTRAFTFLEEWCKVYGEGVCTVQHAQVACGVGLLSR